MKKTLNALLLLTLIFLNIGLFAKNSHGNKKLFVTVAAGPAGVDDDKEQMGSSFILDLDYAAGDYVLTGFHMNFPIYKDMEGVVPVFTLHTKIFVLPNYWGPFLNAGIMFLDEGKDNTDDEEVEKKTLYFAANIGLGFSFRIHENFAVVAGAEIAAAASERASSTLYSFYVGVMF